MGGWDWDLVHGKIQPQAAADCMVSHLLPPLGTSQTDRASSLPRCAA
jgi:hypothetical protein